MRMIMVLTVLMGSSAIGSADSALPAIDPASVPPACAAVAAVPANAEIPQPAIVARIALASCLAEVQFQAAKITPDDAGVAALTAAAKPSFELLDLAIKQSDSIWTPIAQKIRADLFVAMAVRMRNSIPSITPTTTGPALGAYVDAHAAMEPRVKAWLDQAR